MVVVEVVEDLVVGSHPVLDEIMEGPIVVDIMVVGTTAEGEACLATTIPSE